jgi:CopG family nickel-responsive transcriptional regulator
MEVTILRGKTEKVRKFAEHVIAERGVRHGRVMLVPTEVLSKPHSGGHGASHPHPHRHPGTRSRRSA